MMRCRSRTWSTSCSSTTSQCSISSIYPKINQGSPPTDPTEGYTNVYGSFTTTIPAAPSLQSYLSLDIPLPRKFRAKQRGPDCGCDTPPDSPLSGSRQSPSISRTLLTDFGLASPSMDLASLTFPPSPLADDINGTKLHPVLAAAEEGSRLSYRTVCSTCMRTGTNFPRCPHCDEMWCSRACRLQGSKKHSCAIRRM